MADRTPRLLVALAALALASAPLDRVRANRDVLHAAQALQQGTATTPIGGTGAVTVQVFVHKDGTIGAVKIEKSTNHNDDAAALEIAKSSTYKPGVRDAKPIDAFYTMALKFNGSSVINDTGTSSNQLLQANALIRANKYADAKTELQSYLTAHPADKDAQALLGVADAYINDAAGAVAAFDAAGTIPERFKVVAAKAYADAAVDALKAKAYDRAIALSDKALALQQNVNTLYIRGTAYANGQKYPQAIADLEKAKSLAAAGNADAATVNAIDASLATSYVLGGQSDKGIALAQRAQAPRSVEHTRRRHARILLQSAGRRRHEGRQEGRSRRRPRERGQDRAVAQRRPVRAGGERVIARRQARLEAGQGRSGQGARHRPQRRSRELRRRRSRWRTRATAKARFRCCKRRRRMRVRTRRSNADIDTALKKLSPPK